MLEKEIIHPLDLHWSVVDSFETERHGATLLAIVVAVAKLCVFQAHTSSSPYTNKCLPQ